MEDQACPKCKTTMYRNPQMRLLVNVCGHNLCESCVELLFAKGSGSCPECGMALRRTNFRFQLFEDAAIDRDVDIRRRVLRDFNQREEDFSTLREYNDYLEMVEDIIFNLSNNVDVQETNAKIAKYREKNKEAIGKNRVRASKEQLELEDLLHEEAQADRQRESELRREAEEERRLKEDSKQKVIDDLMFAPEGEDGGGGGDAAAADIVARHAREAKNKLEEIRNTKFSTGIDIRAGNASAGGVAVNMDGAPFTYQSPEYPSDGPHLSPGSRAPHLSFVRPASESERPAGYREEIPCARAVAEAMAGLFFGEFAASAAAGGATA